MAGAEGGLKVASADGTPIAVWRSGSGRPLVLVHGTTADHGRWRPVLGALEARATVFAMDRRGRGESGDRQPYALAREFEDVAAVVEEASKVGDGGVDLLGHSHGAICAIGAVGLTDRVHRLLLYEPPLRTGAPVYPEGFPDRMDAIVGAGRPEEALSIFMSEVVRVPPRGLEFMKGLPMWKGRVAAAHTIGRECRAQEQLHFGAADYGHLSMPVRLLLGGDSPEFFKAAVDMVHEAVAQSAVVVLPKQQHAAIDTAPEHFVREVQSFFH